MVDFLIEVGPVVGSPPEFDVGPTPPNGNEFTVTTGDTLEFKVQCSDKDEEGVTIGHLGLPSGATLTPASPTGNPAMGTFSWTPTEAQVAVLAFTCFDDSANSAIPQSYTIKVTDKPVTKFRLLGHDNTNSEILTIDTVTGTATVLGATGFNSGASGLATSRVSVETAIGTFPKDTHFGVFMDDDDGKDYVVVVDPATGLSTKVVEVDMGTGAVGVAFGEDG